MKKLIKIFLLAGVLFMMQACTNEEHPFNLSDADYKVVMDKSLITTGNNLRLKKAIKKLEKGEEVYIACIGGSVTEGAGPRDESGKELWHLGYAYKFAEKLQAKYSKKNGKNIHLDGAGLSGTPSTLGLLRYDNDVTAELNHIPDILVIEFAVNDDDSNFTERGFEGLIRKALLADENTAVIALFADAKTYKNSQPSKKPIASLYKIPMISIQDAVEESGIKIDEEEFFDDYVHPKAQGHLLMADALMNLIAVVDAAKEDSKISFPESPYNKKPLDTLIRITGDDKNVKINPGAFDGTDKNGQTIKKTEKSNFPQNWYRTASAKNNEPFKMEINCRALVFVYKEQGNWLDEKFGTAEVFVDGNKVASYNGDKEGGWNNCITQLIIDEREASDHIVEVKMAPGSEDKGFTIVAMAYCK